MIRVLFLAALWLWLIWGLCLLNYALHGRRDAE